jgi:hypothetical protein
MQTTYRDPQHPYYECRRLTDKGTCWTVAAAGVDEAVARLFLESIGRIGALLRAAGECRGAEKEC